MKKYFPFISFILILSFVLPFFPCFSVLTKAEDSVSSDDAFIKWEKDNVDAIRNGLAQNGLVVNNDYYDNGYYYVDPDDSLWKDILIQWGLDGTDYGKPLSRVVYDYAVSNNMTNSDIYNDCFNTIYNNLSAKCAYYIYDFLNVNDFFTFYNFSNYSTEANLSAFNSALSSVCSDTDCVYFISPKGRNYNSYLLDSTLVKIPRSFFDDGFMVLSSGSFSDIVNYSYQSFRIPLNGSSLPSNVNVNGRISLFDGLSYVTDPEGLVIYDIKSNYWGDAFQSIDLSSGVLSDNPFYIGAINNSSERYYASFIGTSFIYSGDSFSVPVFRSINLLNEFKSGNSYVYRFDPSLDINKYGTDLDLSDLYDVIRNSVDDAEGNIIDSINDIANNYLKDQVELLGDIYNALNDSLGRSWLRLIHGQLDDYFPRTLDKLDDLADALSNISGGGSGGSVDLSNIEDDLSDIKGLLLLQTAHDIIDDLTNDNVDDNDFNDVVTVASTKFPFSIPNDIVTILTLFVAEPEEPEFSFPVPFADNNERFDIDISFIGSSLPYIRGAFIILFILFLVVVSVKVINSLKE